MTAESSVGKRHPYRLGGRRLEGLTVLLARLARLQPNLALGLASAAGAMRNRLTRRWPAVAEVVALFPGMSRRRAAGVAAAIGALEERNDVFARLALRHGFEPIRRYLAVPEAVLSVEGPCIFVTFHVGAIHAIGMVLEAIGRPVLAFRQGKFVQLRAPVEVVRTDLGESERAHAFVRARQHVREGGLLLAALDFSLGATIDAACLGRTLSLARGPFALARVSGAPLVPLVMQWKGRGAVALAGPPIVVASQSASGRDASAVERSLAGAASAWLDRYLRDNPEQLGLGLLRELLHGAGRGWTQPPA